MNRRLLAYMLLTACTVPSVDRDDVAAEVAARMDTEIDFVRDAEAAIEEMLADGELTPDEAVRLAVANNHRLHAILEELEIARARAWSAALLPNPVADVELQFVEGGGGEILELTVTQSILEAILMPVRRQIQGERFESVRAEVTGAVIDLAIETRSTYRELQAQHELAGLYESAADATWLAFEAARRLREAGNIIELDVLTEQALHEETRVALARARARVQELREVMNVLLGLYGSSADRWSIPHRLPRPSAMEVAGADVERLAVERSLDLRAARREILAAGHASGVQRLEAVLHGVVVGGKAEREPGGTWSGGPVAAVPIPVFDFGQAASHEARARLRRSYHRYTDLAIRIRHAVRAAFVAASNAGESSRYLGEVVLPLRARITGRTQLQFNAMQIGVFQLMDARRRELAAGRRYVESLRSYWLARARLEALLMGRLPRARFGIDAMTSGAAAGVAAGNGDGGHE